MKSRHWQGKRWTRWNCWSLLGEISFIQTDTTLFHRWIIDIMTLEMNLQTWPNVFFFYLKSTLKRMALVLTLCTKLAQNRSKTWNCKTRTEKSSWHWIGKDFLAVTPKSDTGCMTSPGETIYPRAEWFFPSLSRWTNDFMAVVCKNTGNSRAVTPLGSFLHNL